MGNSIIIQSFIYAFMLLMLIAIAIIDAKQKIIHQKLLIGLFIGSIAVVFTKDNLSVLSSIGAAVLTFMLLSLVYFISRKAIGFGDVKLCSCVAPYLGMEKMFSMLFIAMIICGLAALILICIKKSNKYKELPFAPFTAIGTIIVLVL